MLGFRLKNFLNFNCISSIIAAFNWLFMHIAVGNRISLEVFKRLKGIWYVKDLTRSS